MIEDGSQLLFGVAVVLATAVGYADEIRRAVRGVVDRGGVDREDRIEDLRQRYLSGELTLAEFEERVALVLDGDAQVLRERIERIDGVGPETSAAIASRFETVEAVREADRSALEAVDGVGPARARAIQDAL